MRQILEFGKGKDGDWSSGVWVGRFTLAKPLRFN